MFFKNRKATAIDNKQWLFATVHNSLLIVVFQGEAGGLEKQDPGESSDIGTTHYSQLTTRNPLTRNS
jgi:hypothetical protein